MSELDDPVKIYDQVVTRIQNEYYVPDNLDGREAVKALNF